MDKVVQEYLSKIGRLGGQKSRRSLDSNTARNMARIREARRAYAQFQTSCFWSFRPEMVINLDDIPWVVEQLRKHGNQQAWKMANSLCH